MNLRKLRKMAKQFLTDQLQSYQTPISKEKSLATFCFASDQFSLVKSVEQSRTDRTSENIGAIYGSGGSFVLSSNAKY